MKYTSFLIAASMLCLTILPGCSSPSVTPEMLVHHNFTLVSVDDKPYQGANVPNIAFNEGMRVSGAICNQFMGQGELQNDVLTVKQLASTKKLCFEDELNNYENLISALLMDGARVEFQNKLLILSNEEHKVVYKLRDWMR